jgi:hypothetical protein
MGAYTQTAEFFMNPESVPFEGFPVGGTLTGRCFQFARAVEPNCRGHSRSVPAD